MAGTFANPRPIDTIEAVNLLRRAVGKVAVSSLGDGSNPSVSAEESALYSESLALQGGNYNFNTILEMELTPDQDNHILLPANTMSFNPSPTKKNRFDIFSQRGDKLFNQRTGSLQFTESVFLDIRQVLPFDDLPWPVRWVITLRAVYKYKAENAPGNAGINVSTSQLATA